MLSFLSLSLSFPLSGPTSNYIVMFALYYILVDFVTSFLKTEGITALGIWRRASLKFEHILVSGMTGQFVTSYMSDKLVERKQSGRSVELNGNWLFFKFKSA